MEDLLYSLVSYSTALLDDPNQLQISPNYQEAELPVAFFFPNSFWWGKIVCFHRVVNIFWDNHVARLWGKIVCFHRVVNIFWDNHVARLSKLQKPWTGLLKVKINETSLSDMM